MVKKRARWRKILCSSSFWLFQPSSFSASPPFSLTKLWPCYQPFLTVPPAPSLAPLSCSPSGPSSPAPLPADPGPARDSPHLLVQQSSLLPGSATFCSVSLGFRPTCLLSFYPPPHTPSLSSSPMVFIPSLTTFYSLCTQDPFCRYKPPLC